MCACAHMYTQNLLLSPALFLPFSAECMCTIPLSCAHRLIQIKIRVCARANCHTQTTYPLRSYPKTHHRLPCTYKTPCPSPTLTHRNFLCRTSIDVVDTGRLTMQHTYFVFSHSSTLTVTPRKTLFCLNTEKKDYKFSGESKGAFLTSKYAHYLGGEIVL